MRGIGLLLSILIVVAASGCAQAPIATPTVPSRQQTAPPSPSPEITVVPTQTPTPTPTPAPDPTVTAVIPTIDPTQVVTTISAAQADLSARAVQPLCLRFEDTDGDGAPDWVGLYVQPTDPPRLSGFVIASDGIWHDLSAQEGNRTGLGTYPTCELAVRDINADGIPEVLVFGHAETSRTLLHVFAWRGSAYALIGAFEGNAGVALENRDGDLVEEIVVGYAKDAQLVWELVYTWDGSSYGWTWDRYRWRTLDRPHVYVAASPEAAVISFYLALNDRDLPGAYRMLSTGARGNAPYGEWALGYATTVRVEVGAVHQAGAVDEHSATAVALVRSYDNVNGRVVARLWDVEWRMTREGESWRLDSARVELLDEREAVYYP